MNAQEWKKRIIRMINEEDGETVFSREEMRDIRDALNDLSDYEFIDFLQVMANPILNYQNLVELGWSDEDEENQPIINKITNVMFDNGGFCDSSFPIEVGDEVVIESRRVSNKHKFGEEIAEGVVSRIETPDRCFPSYVRIFLDGNDDTFYESHYCFFKKKQ